MALRRTLGAGPGAHRAGACCTALAFVASDSIERMDGFIAGLRMRIETPVLDQRIVIVDIDEKSLSLVGRFPVEPRRAGQPGPPADRALPGGRGRL